MKVPLKFDRLIEIEGNYITSLGHETPEECLSVVSSLHGELLVSFNRR